MRKKILCLAMAVLMVLGMQMTVFADPYTAGDDWVAEFNGTNISNTFDANALSTAVSNVQPGDTLTLKIQLKNTSSDSTDWYMKNEIMKALEDNGASGGGYQYKLSYFNNGNTETVLFDSTIAADSQTALTEATGSLAGYFYLGRLDKDQNGSVQLAFTIDGEANPNDYQNTIAQLQMIFAVEKVAKGTNTNVVNNVVKTTRADSVTETVKNSVKTGDTSRIMLLSVIALISGIAVMIIAFVAMKRRNRESKKGE